MRCQCCPIQVFLVKEVRTKPRKSYYALSRTPELTDSTWPTLTAIAGVADKKIRTAYRIVMRSSFRYDRGRTGLCVMAVYRCLSAQMMPPL